jgi:WD40 repeat protein
MHEPLGGQPRPFVGFRPFTETDAPFFFGREYDARVIAENILARPITVLFGQSGVGKSSVLRTLVPSSLEKIEPDVVVVYFSEWQLENAPRRISLALAEAAKQRVGGGKQKGGSALGAIARHDDFNTASRELLPVLHELKETEVAIVYVFDQFEEFFLYTKENNGEKFLEQVAQLASASRLDVHMLFSLRSDRLYLLSDLQIKIPSLRNQLDIVHLTPKQGEEAIRGPIKAYNQRTGLDIRVEDAFVKELLDQCAVKRQEPLDLPELAGRDQDAIDTTRLQIALVELWDAMRRENGTVLRRDLLAKRGVDDIVNEFLERALESSKVNHEVAASILDRMVTPAGTKIAYSLEDLAAQTAISKEDAQAVLEGLTEADPPIINVVGSTKSGAEKYEIRHDALCKPIWLWVSDYNKQRRERELRRKYRNGAIAAVALALLILIPVLFASYMQISSNIRDSAGSAQYQASIGSFDNAFELANESKTRLSWFGSSWLCGLIAKAHEQRWLTFDCGQLHDAVSKAHWSIASRIHQFGVIEKRGGNGNSVWSVGFDPTAPADAPRLVTTGFLGYVHVLDSSSDAPWTFRCTKEFRVVKSQPGKDESVSSFGVRRAIIMGKQKKIVTMSGNGLVGIYDLESDGKQELPLVPGYGGKKTGVRALAVSPLGDWVAAGPYDGSVRLWKLPEGRLLPASLPGGVLNVAFSPDGKLLATAQDDRKVKVYELTSTEEGFGPEPKFVLEGHEDRVTDVAFHPINPNWLASSSQDDTVRIWRLDACGAAKTCSQSVILPSTSNVWAVAFSPDGRLLASGGFDRVIRVWDWEKGKLISELKGHEAQIRSLAFDASGRFLVSGSGDQTVRLWSVEPRYIAARLRLPSETTDGAKEREFEVRSVAIAEPRGPIIVAYRRGLIGVWQQDADEWSHQLLPEPVPGELAKVSVPQGNSSQIFSLMRPLVDAGLGTLWSWRPDQRGRWTPSPLYDRVTSFSLRPSDGREIAVVTTEPPTTGHEPASTPELQRVAIIDGDTAKELLDIPIPRTKAIHDVKFSGDGSRLAVSFSPLEQTGATGDKPVAEAAAAISVMVFELGKIPQKIFAESYKEAGFPIALDERGRLLTIACSSEACRGSAEIGEEKGRSSAMPAEMWGADIWEVDAGGSKPLASAIGHISRLSEIAFSPNGTEVVTTSLDDLVKVWAVDSGEELASLGGHTQDLWALAMAPDGKTLVTGAGDQTVLVRRFYPGLDALAESAKDYLPRSEPQTIDKDCHASAAK